MRESILSLLLVVLSCRMCCNPVHNSETSYDVNDKDSSLIERVFIADRLQDSLVNFLRLVDTSDYYVISKSPGKFCSCPKSNHSYNVVTLCCFTNGSDTIINFYGGIDGFIGFPASHKVRKVFIKNLAVGAKRVNNTMVAVNSYGSISIDSIFDSLFLSRLDLGQYDSMVARAVDYNGNVIPFFKEYVYNGKYLELVFSNEKKVEYLDTVKNLQEVFQ